MNRERLMLKNTFIYAIGNFGTKVLTFFLLPLYTHFLTKKDYGYFDLILSSISLIVPIISLQIQDGIYRDLLDSCSIEENVIIVSNGITILVRNLFLFFIAYVLLIFFINFEGKYLIFFLIILTVIYNFWSQIARGVTKNLQYSIAGILITFFNLILSVILLFFFNYKVKGLIIANSLGYLLAILYLELSIKLRKLINIKLIRLKYWNKLYSYSIPLIPNVLSWWFMNVSDRYLLTYYLGYQSNGIYAIANKLPSLILLINGFFSLAWQDSSITEYNSSDRNVYYSKVFDYYMRIQFTILFLLLAFTKIILKFMVSPDFYDAWKYIPFLYIGSVFASFSVFFGVGYLSSKDTKGAFNTSVVGGIINILVNIISIPIIGIQGASLSTMVAYFFLWLLRMRQTKKYFIITIDKSKLITLSLITVIYVFFYFYENIIVNLILIFFSILFVIIFNKESILKLKNIVSIS